jgi:acyl-CoA synthetase (AMP-forming)/AMP-acid ligase II
MQPTKAAYQFFQGSTSSPEVLTYYSLWEQAAALAYVLQSRGLSNERAMLVFKSQKSFVISFFACLLASIVAVPTAPPRRQSLLNRLLLLARDAQPKVILTDCDEVQQVEWASEREAPYPLDVRLCAPCEDRVALASLWNPPAWKEDATAFLQYTSGSTGDPKGVVISHANLLHNCAAIQSGMALSGESTGFMPLPLYHDMGLVGGVLQAMYAGSVVSFMSPTEVVQYPERWCQIISRFQITVSGGPNFLYELAARAIHPEQIQDIDLSCWRVAFCGAEPIRAGTISRFIERFTPFGFRSGAFYPCYGTAESTLFVTGSEVGTVPAVCYEKGTATVGCGRPEPDTRIEIVDPESNVRVLPGCVGEIWVSGRSVAQGYWNRPEATEQNFLACLAGEETTHFLRTGDLGYIKNGQLYVTGRWKDLVIIRGRKFVPQDLEEQAEESHSALRQSGGAAFSFETQGGDRLALVCEIKREWLHREREWNDVISAIRRSIYTVHGIRVDDAVLIRPGSLPRTSSGKVRRAQCRIDYLDGKLDRVLPQRGAEI